MKKYLVEDIIMILRDSYKIIGNPSDKYFTNLKSTLDAKKDSLVFISSERKDKDYLAKETKASIVICDDSVNIKKEWLNHKCFILVENPRLAISKIGNNIFKRNIDYGIHPTVVIHPNAKIHKDTYIGPFSNIGECEIGKETVIHGNCYIYNGKIKIGKNVKIDAGCIIGADGFGYHQNENREYENFPHIGGVIIEDNVEIGANVCIDRGALKNTHIKKGVKINNHVHIAHNVIIGKHTLITGQVNISGSTIIGDYAYIAPSSTIRDGIKIGDHAKIGMGAVVTKNVPKGETWIGNPAKPINEFNDLQKTLKKMVQEKTK